MKLSDKVKAIRVAEELSQAAFCKIIDLPLSTLKKYEANSYEPSGINLIKITQHERFSKYTLWLMTDKTAPEVGQVSPAIVHTGQNATESAR
ncbi:helix-turn-helix domain-containing protein [Klebsiella michiganensis]|uniref:helix-turn-helix domain-containing protein n=1 Tax=Klebsiella michiganensis TaxID=1134687 RepID=UPI0039826016